jgi:hypothetical protein
MKLIFSLTFFLWRLWLLLSHYNSCGLGFKYNWCKKLQENLYFMTPSLLHGMLKNMWCHTSDELYVTRILRHVLHEMNFLCSFYMIYYIHVYLLSIKHNYCLFCIFTSGDSEYSKPLVLTSVSVCVVTIYLLHTSNMVCNSIAFINLA